MTTPVHYFNQFQRAVLALNASTRSRDASKKTVRYTKHDFVANPSGFSNNKADWETKATADMNKYLAKAAQSNKADGKLDSQELFHATGIHSDFWNAILPTISKQAGASMADPTNMAKALVMADENQDGQLDAAEKAELVMLFLDEYEEDKLGLNLLEEPTELFKRMANMNIRDRRQTDTVYGVTLDHSTDNDINEAAEEYFTEAAQSESGDDTRLNTKELMTAFGMSQQAIRFMKKCFTHKHNIDITTIDGAKKAMVMMDTQSDGFRDGLLFKAQKDFIEKKAADWAKQSSPPQANNGHGDHPNRNQHHHHGHEHQHQHHHQHRHPAPKKPLEALLNLGGFLLQTYAVGMLLKGSAEQYQDHVSHMREQRRFNPNQQRPRPRQPQRRPV